MHSLAFNASKTALSRVWLIDGGASIANTPTLENCLKAMAVSQSFGDIEKIECPDPDQFGQFVEVGIIQGAEERETSQLMGRYPINEESELLRIARARCSVDYHVNFGECEDARNFNDFQKKLIRETVYFTSYNTDDQGALSSDENAVVNETVDTSAKTAYEVLPLNVTLRAGDVIDNPGLDVVICDRPSCGGCNTTSDGCKIIFVLAANGAGSPGTSPDIVWSDDKGSTWAEDDIQSLTSANNASALACVGDYVVVVSNDDGAQHYKLKTTILAGTLLGWTRIATNYAVGGEPNDIWSIGSMGFVVGDGGYVYSVSDPTSGVTVLDAGVATSENLNAVKAISERFAVAVGDNDAVIYTENGLTFQAPTSTPSSGANLICVEIKNENEWLVGSSNGQLWYTTDKGESWTQYTSLPGTTYLAINDIHFSTKSVGYMAVNRTIDGSARGQILRTFSGGGGSGTAGGWVILPEGVQTAPNVDTMVAVYACAHDANFVVGTGLADDGSDGQISIGED